MQKLTLPILIFILLLYPQFSIASSAQNYQVKASYFSNSSTTPATTSFKITTCLGTTFMAKTSSTNYRAKLGAVYLLNLPPQATALSSNYSSPSGNLIFSWKYQDPEANPQAKFQIRLSHDNFNSIIESGIINSGLSEYTLPGMPESETPYLWKICVSDGFDWSSWQVASLGITSPPTSSPQVAGLQPRSGSSYPDQVVSFITAFSDPDGFEDISQVIFLINTSPGYSYAFLAQYNKITHNLALLNDQGNAFEQRGFPGEERVLENSFVRLHCKDTQVSGFDKTLSITWSISFKRTFMGSKNCYLEVKDKANTGEALSLKGTWTISTDKNIDRTPPQGTLKINHDATQTKSTLVTLNLFAQDNPGGSGLSQMMFSHDNHSWSVPEAYATTKSWTLTEGDGEKTVYVKFSDKAGNWSTAFLDTIILDTSLLQITHLTPQDGASFYENETITITPIISAQDASSLEYQFSIDATIKQAWSTKAIYTWTASSGIHKIKVEVRDIGGQDTKEIEVYVFRKPISPP